MKVAFSSLSVLLEKTTETASYPFNMSSAMSPMVFSQNADVKDTETKLQFICKDEQKSLCSLSWGISPQFFADEGGRHSI